MMQFSWECTVHIILLTKLRIVQSNSSPKRHALTVAHTCIWRVLYSLWQPYCCLATSLDDCGQCLIHRCLHEEKKILFSLGLLYWLINWYSILHHTSLLAEASFLRYSAGKRKEVSFPLANQIPGKRGLCLQGNTIHQNFFSSREVRLVCPLDSTIQPLNDWGQYVTC